MSDPAASTTARRRRRGSARNLAQRLVGVCGVAALEAEGITLVWRGDIERLAGALPGAANAHLPDDDQDAEGSP